MKNGVFPSSARLGYMESLWSTCLPFSHSYQRSSSSMHQGSCHYHVWSDHWLLDVPPKHTWWECPSSHKSQKVLPLWSYILGLSTPNWNMISWLNSATLATVNEVIDLYFIHFVNMLVPTCICVHQPWALLNGPIMSSPQLAKGSINRVRGAAQLDRT